MSNWTDDRITLLTKLWMEGMSASAIAVEMGEGLTRNAVIGKVHRLKLANEKRPARPRAAKVATRQSTPRLSSTPRRKAAKAFAGAIDLSFAKAEAEGCAPTIPFVLPPTHNFGSSRAILGLKKDTCKWPLGDPRTEEFRFCGSEADDHSPYCSHHRQGSVDVSSRRRRQDREIERMVG